MAKVKAESKGAPRKGGEVKITGGEHAGKGGKLVHIRQSTQQAHVAQDGSDKPLIVALKDVAAA